MVKRFMYPLIPKVMPVRSTRSRKYCQFHRSLKYRFTSLYIELFKNKPSQYFNYYSDDFCNQQK